MEFIVVAIFLVLVIVWSTRMEMGLNKLNATVERIEKQLSDKKEKK